MPGRFAEAADETKQAVVEDQLIFCDAIYDLPVLAKESLFKHNQAAKAKIERY